MAGIDVVILGELNEDLGDLSSEVLRAKAALLYGDRVSLTSHKIPLLLARMAFKSRIAPEAVRDAGGIDKDVAEGIARVLEQRWSTSRPPGELAERNMEVVLGMLRGDDPNSVFAMPEIIAQIVRSDEERQRRDDPAGWFQAVGPVAVENYVRTNDTVEPAIALKAVDELIALNSSSLVDIDWGATDELGYVELDDLEASFGRSVQQAVEMLTDAARREHPLFTQSTRLSLQQLRDQGQLDAADFTRANRVELAARLVTSIPCFPDATVDEIVDLRARVATHLERFRAAVADFEDELNADVISDQFDGAVDDIRQRHVDPALEELRVSLHEAGAARALVRAIPTLGPSTVALGASLAAGAYELAGVAAVAAGATTAAAREMLERTRQENERKKHRLFLLFEAGRQLSA